MTRWFRGWFRNGGEPALSRHLQRAISDEEEADFVEALRGYDYPLDWSNDQDLEDLRRVW